MPHKIIFFFIFFVSSAFPIFADDIKTDTAVAEEKAAAGDETSASSFSIGEVVPRDRGIVIRGKRISTIEEASTGSEITGETIESHADRSLDDTLAAVPGLYVDTHTKGHKRVRLRGFDQDRVLILMDGIPVNDVYSSDFDISTIPVINISHIIVTRGTSSAMYGAGGAAGVINIVSKKPAEFFAQAGLEYGEYGNWTITAANGSPIGENFYYWLTAGVYNSDGYAPSARLDRKTRRKWFDKLIRYGLYPDASSNPYTFDTVTIPAKNQYINDTGTWDHTDYRKYDVSCKLGYDPGAGFEAGIIGRFNSKEGRSNTYEAICFSDYKMQNGWWKDPVFTATQADIKKAALRNRAFVWPETWSLLAAPYLRFSWENIDTKLVAFYSMKSATEKGYASTDHAYLKDQAVILSSGSFYDPYYDIKTYVSTGANLFVTVNTSESNKVTLCNLWRYESMLAQQQGRSAVESPHIAASIYGLDPYNTSYLDALYMTFAVEDEMRVTDKISVSAGISYDTQKLLTFKQRHDVYFYEDAYIIEDDSMIMGTRDAFNPAIGFVYNAVQNILTLKTSGSIKTRFPLLGEYDKIDSTHDYGLKPERIYNFNAGYELALLSDRLHIGSDFYHTTVTERIKKIAGGTEPPVNIDRMVVWGFENSAAYNDREGVWLLKKIKLGVTYTYLNARNYDDSPEEAVNKGEYVENIPAHQFTLSAECTFPWGTCLNLWGEHTSDEITYVMNSRPAPDPATTPFSTSYFSTEQLHEPFFLNIRVSQQFLDHVEVYAMCKNILDDYRADPFSPGPGRTFYAGIKAGL